MPTRGKKLGHDANLHWMIMNGCPSPDFVATLNDLYKRFNLDPRFRTPAADGKNKPW